jgi:hypothetical protein
MAEVINTNVFNSDKKFVDFSGLDYFWEKAKAYVDGVDTAMSGKISTLETTVGNADSGLVKEVASLRAEMNALGGIDGGDGIGGMIDAKINALNLPNTYDAKGAAAAAETAAKAYADGLAGNYDAAGTAAGLNTAMDARVAVLEAIDHDKLAADAAAAAVATVLDDAPAAFDTLKEVAEWISNNDHATDVADLVADVAALKAIDHNAYVAADEVVLAAAKTYADDEIAKLSYDEAGAAAAAEAAAKAYVDGKVDGKFDTVGAAAQALVDAKADTDSKLAAYTNTTNMTAAIEAAKSAAIADADAKLADFYNKKAVENLLAENAAADQAYAKAYTDALFGSFTFAGTTDIDSLFA